MAIDPVTLSLLAKGAGKLLGKIGPAVGTALGARAGAEALKQDPEQIAKQYADLRASMPQYGVGSAFNEYLAMAKQDPAADMQRQIAAEQEASSIGALKAGGAKALLGGLGSSQRQAARQRMGIEEDAAKRQMSALQTYGAQQQRVQDMNTRMQQQLAQSQFQAERGAEQYNRQLEAQKKQAMGQALGALAGQFGKGNFKDLLNVNTQTGSETPQVRSLLDGLEGLSATPAQTVESIQPGQIDNPALDRSVSPSNITLSGLIGNMGQMTPMKAIQAGDINPQGNFNFSSLLNMVGPTAGGGGMQVGRGFNFGDLFARPSLDMAPRLEEGGMMTEGAFSHETNPIDIMQDGAKVGEMTGGEAILNPEQQKKVAKQSPYFRKLMREFAMRNRK